MGWFNYYGLAIMALILLPNIVYAIMCKDGFVNSCKNKLAVVLEQIGRYGCMILMVFNIPYTYLNFWFDNALTIYLVINGCLCAVYLICWVVFWHKNGKIKALLLSIVPSAVFLFSGVMLASFPLIAFAVIFAINHIFISCKNVQ